MGLANLGELPKHFSANFCPRIFRPCFSRASAPPPPKHSRPLLSAFLSNFRCLNRFMPIFCLQGRSKNVLVIWICTLQTYSLCLRSGQELQNGPFLEIRAKPENKTVTGTGAIKKGFVQLKRFLLQGPWFSLRGHRSPLQALGSRGPFLLFNCRSQPGF